MRDLTVRLDALDPDAGAALRVIAYFDDLMAHEAGLQSIVRAAAVLAACPAGLVVRTPGIRVRVDAAGVAGSPGQRDPVWPWVSVGAGDGELWLERNDDRHPVDDMVLERAAAAAASVLHRTRRRSAAHAQDQACVEVLLDPEAAAEERAAAARRLGLSQTGRARAVAVQGGPVLIVPADAPESGDRRAGIGPTVTLDGLPESGAAARLALRLTAEGTSDDPGPRIVRAEQAGGLLVLASAVGPDTPRHPDVLALDRAAGAAPWLLSTLDAVADAPSLRSAATALHVHHSTLQERIAHAERMLGWSIGDPAGRLRLTLALTLRRLHRTSAG
jgi:hypothetical protein